jgi:sialidase-1
MQPSAFPLQVPLQHPADDGLVLYLPFQEGSGRKARDLSGKDNHGILINGPVWGAGKHGWGLVLDGIDDKVRIQYDPSMDLEGKDFTLMAWIKPDSFSQNNPIIVGDWNFRISLGVDESATSTSELEVWINSSENRVDTSSNSISTGQWQHAAVTFRNSTRKLTFYVNGAQSSSTTATNTPNGFANGWGVGGELGINSHFDGMIDEVLVYDRVLSADEIRRHYEQTRL